MSFKIEYTKLVRWLTPHVLRQQGQLAWLDVLVWPVVQLYQLFGRQRNAVLYGLAISPQVCFLEKLLNDRFDKSLRRIKIDDPIDRPPLYAYLAIENKPVYLGSKPLYLASESGAALDDFIVYVPAGLVFGMQELRQLLDNYKLAATRYTVQLF